VSERETPLSRKMRAAAEAGHPDGKNLLRLADEFDAAKAAFYAAEPLITAQKYLGCFARAKLAYEATQ
jgi:hypothetical protein